MPVLQLCQIDGTRCDSLAGAAAEVSAALGLEVPWYGNLGALDAILDEYAGADGQRLYVVWRNSAHARQALGYAETCHWLEDRARVWDPSRRQMVEDWLADARGGVGATLFDAIVEVIERHPGVALELG